MKILDTDTLTLFFSGHERVVSRRQSATDEVAITIISRIETLQGRFAMLLRAPNGAELRRAHQWLDQTVDHLTAIPEVFPIDDAAAAEFDRLREHKKLKKIGRGDLLIASIALANRATLVTRNLKDFRQVHGLLVENCAD
jgi:tRNA(fMet)-specific endonuclease VapC